SPCEGVVMSAVRFGWLHVRGARPQGMCHVDRSGVLGSPWRSLNVARATGCCSVEPFVLIERDRSLDLEVLQCSGSSWVWRSVPRATGPGSHSGVTCWVWAMTRTPTALTAAAAVATTLAARAASARAARRHR